jgi:hypothetical protein
MIKSAAAIAHSRSSHERDIRGSRFYAKIKH